MEAFSFGQKTSRTRGSPVKKKIQVRTSPVKEVQAEETSVCSAPQKEESVVTQYEKRVVLDKAYEKQLGLPELVILENTISLYGYDRLNEIKVCKVDNAQDSGPGSVNDPLMGVIEGNQLCSTCHLDNYMCPGHLGMID